MRSTDESGFTLIEALVALAILAVAAAGLVRASEAHIDTIRGVQTRAAAQWAAENAMAELHVGAARATALPSATLLGQTYILTAATRATDDPDLLAVKISVTPPSAVRPIATLDGFLDRGT